MKKLLFIPMILMILGMVNFASATMFTFENASTKKCVFVLYWFDHEFESLGPAAVHGGEYGPGKKYIQQIDYPGKIFGCHVFNDDKAAWLDTILQNTESRIHYTWDGETLKGSIEK